MTGRLTAERMQTIRENHENWTFRTVAQDKVDSADLLREVDALTKQNEQLVLALRANGRIDSPEVARVIDDLKIRLTASEAEAKTLRQSKPWTCRVCLHEQPVVVGTVCNYVCTDCVKKLGASEARVEEAFRAGFESCAHNVGRCESGSYLRINPDEALAAWRSQHAAFTVPGTISVTGKDATFTKCDGDHAAVVPCVDPECWNRDAPVVGGGDGCKDTIWRDVLPAPAGKPAHAEEPHHLEEPEADGHDHHHADDDLDGPVDGKLLDRPQQ